MKTKILNKIPLLIAVGLIFTACNNDVVRSTSSEENDNSTNVYFSNDNNTDYVLPIDTSSFAVTVVRKVTNAAQSVALTIESPSEGIFSIPSTANFNAGDSSTTVLVSISNDIELMKEYHFTLVIDQNETKQYTKQDVYPRLELNVIKEDYNSYADGTYTSIFFGDSWPAILQYSPSSGYYRFKDCWVSGYDYIFKVNADSTITQVPATTETGYVSSKYGMISVTADPDKSYFDGDSTYTFVDEWTVSAGSYGVDNDTFVVSKRY